MQNFMRLSKFLSQAGICSRRKAEEYIQQGLVTVNGEKIVTLGTKIEVDKDTVLFKNKKVSLKEKPIYIILNKPKGYITSCKHRGEKIVLDLINIKQRVYPVGRLDKNSCGLILLSNDGNLHYKLSHPSFNHEKEYFVTVKNELLEKDIEKLKKGVLLNNKKTRPAKFKKAGKKSFYLTLKEGRKRQIRRVLELLNNKVLFLKRIRIGNLKLDGIEEGKWRFLTSGEKDILLKSVE